MASCGGRFEQFIEDAEEDFESYVERMEHYLRATKVSDDLKVSVFVRAIGKQAYRTLKTLLTPVKPEQKDYAHLVAVLREHYAPKPMVIAERFRFNRRAQLEKETVATYTVELKRLAATCEFGQFLDEALRDRFVAGLKDQAAQAELLKKKTLTFSAACDIARSIELTRAETKIFQPAASEQLEVNAVQRLGPHRNVGAATRKATMEVNTERPEASGCFRCGAPHHESSCPFRKYKCRACRRVGHLARACKATSRLVQAVDDSSGEEKVWLYNIGSCSARKGGYTTEVRVAGTLVTMQVDTGGSVSIVPEEVYKQYWPGLSLSNCRLKLKTYGGVPLEVLGKLIVPVEHNGQTMTLSLVVVRTPQKCETVLMGRDWLEALRLDWMSVYGRVSRTRVACARENGSPGPGSAE
ncbi:uncharacterized protein LOC120840511 [Ixodes scapularis]|uniref:uncharacterized protein LOC120840511 n=1 Tax=Ixodes scapularis TaxID=6945 RepID=UPI001A9E82D5|nr:uncharacterized protein LOC120840511 [Ixodes scapularis]